MITKNLPSIKNFLILYLASLMANSLLSCKLFPSVKVEGTIVERSNPVLYEHRKKRSGEGRVTVCSSSRSVRQSCGIGSVSAKPVDKR